jgi:hypothetical protein
MDSEKQPCSTVDRIELANQTGPAQPFYRSIELVDQDISTGTTNGFYSESKPSGLSGSAAVKPCPSVVESVDTTELLSRLRQGELWMVNSRRRNGLILIKPYHAEFAGPGAAVGSFFDADCQQVISVGNLSLVRPEGHEERQKAYLIRRQWIRLTQQFTDRSLPLQRAQMILNQFENYFDRETIARIPDEAFAMLVGVLPYSVRMARRTPGKLNVKLKT